MTRPLYQSASEQPTSREPDGHAGLWFDKFCDRWRVKDGWWTMSADDNGDNAKLTWIRGIADGGSVGTRDQIEECALRLVRLVDGRGGRSAVFATESRFVTGLGRSHPVENGFTWHPTLGTPYLPGSSIKGLVRSWAREQADPLPDPKDVDRLLGAPGSAGGVCFLDALPTAPVRLEADVMTPHYAGWHKEDPPGDWRSPKPIPFLVTAAGTRFLFGIVRCRELGGQDLDVAMGWLNSALAWTGAGAKTAVGYGRMVQDDAARSELSERVRARIRAQETRRRHQKRLAGLSPLERELEEIAQERKDLPHAYLAWLKALEDGRWSGCTEMEAAVAQRIKDEMQEAGKWKPTSAKKRPEKDKDHQRTLVVKRFIRE